MKRLALLAVAALAAGCIAPTTDLSNKRCDANGQCLAGYNCVNGLCVGSGSTGGSATTGASGSSGTTSSTSSTTTSSSTSTGGSSSSGSTTGTASGSGSSSGSSGSSGSTGTCSAEVCDGRDNDCDGVPDNVGEDGGFACVMGANDGGLCQTSCDPDGGGLPGALTCDGTCGGYSVCTPPAEVCNGVDDDCDGTPDDNLAGPLNVLADDAGYVEVALASRGGRGLAAYTVRGATQQIAIQPLDANLSAVGPAVGRPPTGDQTSPAVVVLDGGFRVAWLEPGSVYSLPVSATGSFGSPSVVNATYLNPIRLAAASNAAGEVAYAWDNQRDDGGAPRDLIVKVGSNFEQNISLAQGGCSSPDIAAVDGGWAVAFSCADGVHVDLLGPTGSVTHDEPVSASLAVAGPRLGHFADGLVVVWEGQSGGLRLSVISAAGAAGPVSLLPSTRVSGLAAADGNGRTYLAWVDADGGSQGVQVVRLADDAGVASGPFTVGGTTAPDAAPALTFTGTNFGFAWIARDGGAVDATQACY